MNVRLWFAAVLLSIGAAQADNVWVQCPGVVGSNSVAVTFKVIDETPKWVGVVIWTNSPMEEWRNSTIAAARKWHAELQTNSQAQPEPVPEPPSSDYDVYAKWIPFTTNLLVELGAGDGRRELWLGFRYGDQARSEHWERHRIVIRKNGPTIHITSPREAITPQPMIQLKGYCSVPLQNIRYDVLDQSGHITLANHEGFVNAQDYDSTRGERTASYFTCYDIDLSPGTNTIVFRAADDAGNSVQTNFIYVFSTAGVVTGPSLSPEWPSDNNLISSSTFTMHGQCDDYTAHILALVANSHTQTLRIDAETERNGRYWVEGVPLLDGRTYVTLIAINAAGYSTVTNVSVRKSRYKVAMDPIVPASKLWQRKLTITGTTTYNLSNYAIRVNGIKAEAEMNGHWRAQNVPVTSGEGVASFDIEAVPNDGDNESDESETEPAAPIAWGEGNHGIKWGVYLDPGDTNHMNLQHCDFYLLNDSGTNMNFVWMRPRPQALYECSLVGPDGKAVSYSYSGKQTGWTLAANLNTHQLGSNAIEQIDGILPLPTNAPVRLTGANLTELFSNLAPGKYKFRCSGRLYQIAPTGNLVPVELPPVTIPVTIEPQPSELAFHLRRLEAKGEFAAGEAAEGLRAGAAHNFEPQPVGYGDEIEIYLMNTTTNAFQNLILPQPDQQFAIALHDDAGKEVPRTNSGRQQGKPPLLDGSPVDLQPVFLAAGDVSRCARFNLNAYLEIKSPGPYRMKYQQRLFQVGTDGTAKALTLPQVEIEIQIR